MLSRSGCGTVTEWLAPSGQVDEGERRHPHRAGVVLVGALLPRPRLDHLPMQRTAIARILAISLECVVYVLIKGKESHVAALCIHQFLNAAP